MTSNRRLAILAALVLVAAAGCKDTTGPRLPGDGGDPDIPPQPGQSYVAPASSALYA